MSKCKTLKKVRIIQYVLITITLFFLSNCNKPNPKSDKIDNIEFSYHGALRIPYNEVVINMEINNDKMIIFVHSRPLFDDLKWKYSKIDTVLFTDVKVFNTLAKSVVLLDKIDIDKAHYIGNDGYTCKIEYGAKGKNKSYSFWSPTSNTQERGLIDFLNLCEQILDIARLKKHKIIK